MSLLDRDKDKPSKWAVYVCPKCDYKTNQLRGLPEVMHTCPKTKRIETLKETP